MLKLLDISTKDAKMLIITGASPVVLGGLLIQEQHGVKRIISYASKNLSDVESVIHRRRRKLWQSFGRVSIFMYTYVGSNSSCTQTTNR